MPQIVKCSRCGYILYDSEKDANPKFQVLKSPYDVLKMYSEDGRITTAKCPSCGKKLSIIPKSIEVKPYKWRVK